MTRVRIDLQAPRIDGPSGANGEMKWRPTARHASGDAIVLPAPFKVHLAGGPVVVEVEPSGASWAWEVLEPLGGGSRVLAVPNSAEPVEYADLVTVDPSTLAPTEGPEAAWWAFAEATVVEGEVVGDNLVLRRTDGVEVIAGNVRGPVGDKGDNGAPNVLKIGTVTSLAQGAAATAAILGDAPVQTLNLGLPRGDKGDVGGFVASLATSADLDTILTAGLYTPASGAGTLALNYPSTQAGTLLVFDNAGSIVQQYVTNLEAVYVRRRFSGAWSAWRAFRPGGSGNWSLPDELGTADLNTIVSAGVYRLLDGTAATLARNYPTVGGAGSLEVLVGPNPSDVLQRYTPAAGNANGSGRVMYVRRYFGAAWGPWYVFTSDRIDQAAGRAVYSWDPVNGREQFVYGDTGWRSVPPLNGFNGSLLFRRLGRMVTLKGDVRPVTGGTNLNGTFGEIPAGFAGASTPWIFHPIRANASGSFFTLNRKGTELVIEGSPTLTDTAQCRFEVSWVVDDAWPTVLPGTASGTIPNL